MPSKQKIVQSSKTVLAKLQKLSESQKLAVAIIGTIIVASLVFMIVYFLNQLIVSI